MAAVMCMLTKTEMADQARGAVMSKVLSMHSGVAKLLGEKTGHPGQLIKARMGDVDSWTGRSKDSSHKVSKHWRFNAQADGSIKCSGLAVDLQRLHSALGGGQHLNCDDEQRVVWAADRRARRVELDEQPGSTVDDLHHAGAPRLVRGRL